MSGGWRLRAIGAYGRYHYDGALLIDGGYVPTTFDGEDAFLSALVGYQLRNGRLITKLSSASKPRTSTSSPTTRTTLCKAPRLD
jgi:hypothetical protein